MDAQGWITYSARYTPWGDTLESYGTGNFSFGYLGGLMDTATGLLNVGNGQYYDPTTGRFLNRNAKPDQTNPYVPWGGNPSGALMAPLALLSLVYSRKKKRGKLDTFIILLVLGVTLSMSLTACVGGTTPPPTISVNIVTVPTPTPGIAIATISSPEIPGAISTPVVVSTPCPDTTITFTQLGTPTPMVTSGYYIPTESQAKDWYAGNSYPIPAPTWVPDKDTYLVKYEKINDAAAAGVKWSKNWAGGFPAQYANEVLLYDHDYVCEQGSGQLNNGHFIACDTTYTWKGFLPNTANPPREDIAGFRWADEGEAGLINSLVKFNTVAVCGTSTLKGTIQLVGLGDSQMKKLKENGNSDAIFKVRDIGQGLCPENNKEGNRVDIFTGFGTDGFNDASIFFSKSVQVYSISSGN